MQRFEAVIFDLDGTLVDSGSLVAQSAIETFQHFKFPTPTKAEIIAYMGIPIEVYFPKLAGPAFEAHDAKAVFADYRMRFKRLVESGHLKAFDGIADILAALKTRGIKTGVATSKETAPAVHSCEYAGLLPYLDAIVGSDLVKAYKPAPDTVLVCLEKIGLPSGPQVCVVGDAEADMGMGSGAGATTCGVTWGAHDAQRLANQKPSHIVETRDDLARFLGIIP
ncbi:MAG: HAD family hydrolase [Alphaproteobacteria bacterium]|nr:HAD family hydrolase [Alphaproteobacteria bacterium]